MGPEAKRIALFDMAGAGADLGRIIPGVLHAFADAHPERRALWFSASAVRHRFEPSPTAAPRPGATEPGARGAG
ncbi:hypothetical protein SAMN05216270_12048 [Glycomyces harbinensis]|uniref:Uncharacterized protein n=2 Tax=Glycomyces harbinensis TaxID=58114 RepID=A0A1G7CKQ3_9ACTN|nr:hypothetical protein SAMN05216270_12048 [Glycomyces harbinensis]